MVCQQFGGINAICFYVANIFESAGTDGCISLSADAIFVNYFFFNNFSSLLLLALQGFRCSLEL